MSLLANLSAKAYSLLSTCLGVVPWAALLCWSLPWSAIHWAWIANRHEDQPDNDTEEFQDAREDNQDWLGEGDVDVANLRRRIALCWYYQFALINVVAATCALWYSGMLMMEPGLQVLLSYFLCFATAAIFRTTYRLQYGVESEEAKEVDEALLAVFGVYLVQRGSTSTWIYPVLSVLPTYMVYSLATWFTRDDFPMYCKRGANTTSVLDYIHCSHALTEWDFLEMGKYVGGDVLYMYTILRGVAMFLVRMDPNARGTLSELVAWQEKMRLRMRD